ncbi:DUF4178 domain-containing protein [Solwaraspora sp. WMMA2056]|uniref:DUF4178 domain-containing protein n=1 Tax=Solwaraspora sp. WMMA2056 TaxID=3015161 RepID=UPI00259BBA2A|nr:DUF4178 domain-containing protein [Solwaraspora sp. WMMA2056]WJK38541.1 DUF4178 domain-containing protein [Solwaraspora sp. WMMA2056]
MNGTVAYLVTGLGCLIAVAGIAAVAVGVWRAKVRSGTAGGGAAKGRPVDPFHTGDTDAVRGDPRRLGPGDIVEFRGQSYAVRGSVHFTEGSWTWSEHFLDDARGDKLWLSVESDPDLELVLWRSAPADLAPTPGARSLDVAGRRYRLDESGQARFTSVGATGLAPSGSVRYHDYVAPDDARLSFEGYGDSPRWEIGLGEVLHRAEVMIYPAGGPGSAGRTV